MCSILSGYGAMDIGGLGMIYVQLSWSREQMLTLYSSFDAINVPKWPRSTWTRNLARVHVERATLARTARVYTKCFICLFAVSSYSIYFAANSAGKLIRVLGTWNSQNTRGFVDWLSRYISWWRSVLGEMPAGFSGGTWRKRSAWKTEALMGG